MTSYHLPKMFFVSKFLKKYRRCFPSLLPLTSIGVFFSEISGGFLWAPLWFATGTGALANWHFWLLQSRWLWQRWCRDDAVACWNANSKVEPVWEYLRWSIFQELLKEQVNKAKLFVKFQELQGSDTEMVPMEKQELFHKDHYSTAVEKVSGIWHV